MKEQILDLLKKYLPITNDNVDEVAEVLGQAANAAQEFTVGESAIGGDDAISADDNDGSGTRGGK